MGRFSGKRVLITGGARGIGRCTAREFARAGAELVLTDLDGPELREAKAELNAVGAVVHTRVVDVSSREQVDALAAWVVDELGGLDVLINNAGVGHQGALVETSLEKWKLLIDVNLMGPLYHVYAFLPHFREKGSGHIVNVSSGQAYFRLPAWGAYAAVKAALGVFSEVLHYELKKYGVTVTTFYPFMVNTGFYNEIEGDTFGGRLAMKLVPWYSMKPEKVGRILYRAVKKRRKIEMVSVLNDAAFYVQVVPKAPGLIARATDLVLNRRAGRVA